MRLLVDCVPLGLPIEQRLDSTFGKELLHVKQNVPDTLRPSLYAQTVTFTPIRGIPKQLDNEIDWLGNDALGNTRFLGGVNVTYYSDFYPFGGEREIYEDGYNQPCPNGCNPVPTNYLFTGKERDPESGLDNFGARYFTSTYGPVYVAGPEID